MAVPRRDVTGAILAGGRGRRAGGVDKGLVAVHGEAAVARIARQLRGQVGHVLVSANRNHAAYEAMGFTAVSDAKPGFHGPLCGIAATAAATGTPWLLTVPVDCIDVPPSLCVTLAAGMADDVDVCVAHDGERRQPLFALYRRECALRAAARPDDAVWRFQDRERCLEVEFPPGTRFANRNAPEDAPC